MPPPKRRFPNSLGPTNSGAGKASKQAPDPATGAPTDIVDPFRGHLIGDVNPVTGNSHEGFNPMTGQLYDHQPGRMEIPPLRSPRSPQYIPKSPPPSPPRGGNQKPEPNRPGTPSRHSPSPHPNPPGPPTDFRTRISWEVYSHGEMLDRAPSSAMANHKE